MGNGKKWAKMLNRSVRDRRRRGQARRRRGLPQGVRAEGTVLSSRPGWGLRSSARKTLRQIGMRHREKRNRGTGCDETRIEVAGDVNLAELKGIHKSFYGVEVLHGVDLYLKPGSVHALMGENGAGKSTLMKVLAGVHKCDAGEVVINGKKVEIDSPAKAQELGMTATTFKNCTGLDAEGHVTSAYDVAVMSGELIKHDLIKNYSTVWMDSLRDGKSELVNTNKLVRFYEGTTGLKTGTTSTAKYCLSATAERNGLELVAVVMAGESSDARFNGAKKLLDYGFANYNFSSIDAEIADDFTLQVDGGTQKTVAVKPDGNLNVLLPKTVSGDIVRETVFKKDIKAPVKKGDLLGTVTVKLGDEQLGEIPVVASEDVGKLTFGVALGWILKGLFQL